MASRKKEEELSRLENLFKLRAERDKGTPFNDEAFERDYPTLYYFLNATRVGDKITERAYIRLQNEGGDVQLSIVQPGAGVACEVLAQGVQEAFRGLEAKLAVGDDAWRFFHGHKAVLRSNGKPAEKE